MKKEYRTPVLEELGSLADLTLGDAAGDAMDADFSRGCGDLFS